MCTFLCSSVRMSRNDKSRLACLYNNTPHPHHGGILELSLASYITLSGLWTCSCRLWQCVYSVLMLLYPIHITYILSCLVFQTSRLFPVQINSIHPKDRQSPPLHTDCKHPSTAAVKEVTTCNHVRQHYTTIGYQLTSSGCNEQESTGRDGWAGMAGMTWWMDGWMDVNWRIMLQAKANLSQMTSNEEISSITNLQRE